MRLGSLCTGILGLDLATEAVFGGELAWCSEVEPAAWAVIERHRPGTPNLGDLTAVDWLEVEPVDVLTAGFPCQPFSHAGKRKGTKDARHLWPHIADAVRVLRPRLVVLENVAGHLSLGFDSVLGDLAEAGFDAEWCVLRASDVGAPHARARVFIVAADPGGERHGGRQDTRGMGSVDGGDAGATRERQRARTLVGDPSGTAAADPSGTAAADPSGTAAADPSGMGRGPRTGLRESEPGGERRGRPRDDDGASATDSDRGRLQERSEPDRRSPEPRLQAPRRRDVDRLGSWGDYEPAIRRWEHVLGRPAPRPTDDRGRLNPPFVEWMMGYPEGWVDGLTRNQALKALGNAVVPQQGEAAVRLMAHLAERAA